MTTYQQKRINHLHANFDVVIAQYYNARRRFHRY